MAPYVSARLKPRQRDLAHEAVPAIALFLHEVDEEAEAEAEAEGILDTFVFTRQAATERVERDALKALSRIDEEGVRLLGLEAPVTLGNLKAAYRKASLAHHPDRGGSTSTMQAVNRAFTAFHETLCNEIEAEADEGGEHPERRDAASFILHTRGVLLGAQVDLWDIDAAFATFTRLQDRGGIKAEHFDLLFNGVSGSLLDTLANLTKRLTASGRTEDARQVLGAYENVAEALMEDWLNPEYVSRTAGALRKRVESGKRGAVVLNHPIQVENAYRLGIIDDERYRKYVDKFEAAASDEEELARHLAVYVTSYGFVPVISEDSETGAPPPTEPARDPGYETRLSALDSAQKSEYVRAFSPGTTLKWVRKYELVRLNDLIRTAFLTPDLVEDVVREIALIKEVQPKDSRAATSYVCDEVSTFLRSIRRAPGWDRRSTLLHRLDSETERVFGGQGVMILLSSSGVVDDSWRIRAHPSYYRRAASPVEALEAALASLEAL